MSDTILRTQNYYSGIGIDPNHYYKNSAGAYLEEKATRAMPFKDVYISDLLNNEKCTVSFSEYRDTDNKTAPLKIRGTSTKNGIVRSYNPETKLLAIDSAKRRPSRISAMFKRTNKMRYVEPNSITVSSISRSCALRRVKRTSNASPKASATVDLFDLLDSAKSKGSARGSAASAAAKSRGGRGGKKRTTPKRLTRKRRQPRK
jgi:hypothetical protein